MALRWYVVHAFSQYEKKVAVALKERIERFACLLYTSPSPRDGRISRMPSSA